MKDVVNCPCCPDYFTSTSKKTKRDKQIKKEKKSLLNDIRRLFNNDYGHGSLLYSIMGYKYPPVD